MVDNYMCRRQMERSGNWRRGAAPMLERRTVWRDRSLSPTTERGKYSKESTLGCYQKRSERRDSFTINESSSSTRRQRHGHRERLNNNSELSSRSSTSARTGPMGDREYLDSELTKQYWVRDRLAIERARSDGARSHGEVNRNVGRIQPSEYGSERMRNYHLQHEPQLASEEIAGKTSSMADWRIEDLLGEQSMLNAHSIQNAQAWIANDSSLSPAQVARARQLLQELLITITTKPDLPNAEGKPPNFVDRRISDCIPSRIFSQQNTQSAGFGDSAVHGRELPVMQNPLLFDSPLTASAQNWRSDAPVAYPHSGDMAMSSRDMSKNLHFRYGSRNDCPAPYVESADFGQRSVKEPTVLGSQKRRSPFHDRRRLSRSRSRSVGKDFDKTLGERRVHMKSQDIISVEINHPQKGSRRKCSSHETPRSHHRESRGERSSRCLSPPSTRSKRRRR